MDKELIKWLGENFTVKEYMNYFWCLQSDEFIEQNKLYKYERFGKPLYGNFEDEDGYWHENEQYGQAMDGLIAKFKKTALYNGGNEHHIWHYQPDKPHKYYPNKEINVFILGLVKAFRNFRKEHDMKCHFSPYSKIYHNLGRMKMKHCQTLIDQPQLLYQLLSMPKVKCMKHLKELKLI